MLKESVTEENKGETPSPNSVQFVPSLPDWKAEAIKRLGYGNLNKVNFNLPRIINYVFI